MKRDLEVTLWEVYESITDDGLEAVDRRLKALDLLVKIRKEGERVNPLAEKAGRDAALEKVQRQINGA